MPSRTLLLTLIILLALTSCVPASDSPEPAPVKHTYTPSEGPLLNPERGFFTPFILPGPVGFSPLRLTGKTLVHLNIRLDDYRATDLPQEILDGLQVNFDDLREAGLKAIIRFAYNQGPYPDTEPDASKAWVLRHIEQLTPLLQKNAAVIAWVEAGFIGAWGEWHTSTNGLDNLTNKRDILDALVAAIPNRYVQVRYPANIIEMYPNPQEAVTARVAHHNDCFLSSSTDVGTYERDGTVTIERDQAYLAELTQFTPMSGETCAPNPPRSECNSAIREMELLHFSAINEAYHKGILRSWQDGGCLDEITDRLGYRLTLTEATFNEQIRPGGLLNLTVSLKNTGFAALMNPRPLYIVLLPSPELGRGAGGEGTYLTKLDLDPRTWQPGDSAFSVKLRLPSNMAQGQYNLALWLPDEAESLSNNPLYAVRFANDNVWDEKTGHNLLGTINISKSTTGSTQKVDFLTVEELTAAEAVPLPTATSAPTATPEPVELVSGVQISNDSEYLNLQFAFTGVVDEYNAIQAFLDTDQNPATGFSVNGLGADFLLENGALNAYAGTGSDWAWTPLENEIIFLNAEQTARWSVLRADLGNPAALEAVFQLVDANWDTVFVTPKHAYAIQK
jgi:hypothetical protein